MHRMAWPADMQCCPDATIVPLPLSPLAPAAPTVQKQCKKGSTKTAADMLRMITMISTAEHLMQNTVAPQAQQLRYNRCSWSTAKATHLEMVWGWAAVSCRQQAAAAQGLSCLQCESSSISAAAV